MKASALSPLILFLLVNGCSTSIDSNQNAGPSVSQVANTNSTPHATKTRTPESRGATHLTQLDSFKEAYREAAHCVAQELIKDHENPDEFYAEVESRRSSSVIIFHLWHKDAFKEENASVIGNPGGKCRDVHYDVKRQRVTGKFFWQ